MHASQSCIAHTVLVVDGGVEQAAATAAETASQLLAKILNQLSLSAWLPSGALVLLVGFVLELGTAIDAQPHSGAAVSAAFVAIGHISIGSLLLMGGVTVVVTMLTQAFSFGAIRVMEGYWGTSRVMESVASARANRHRSKRSSLYTRYCAVRSEAIDAVLLLVATEQQALIDAGQPETFTKSMRDLVEARVKALRQPANLVLSPEQRRQADDFDWRSRADRNLARRELNLIKRLEDYPSESDHVLPTRFGNVLRRHEDATGLDEVEDFVDRVFDDLPFSLRLTHDEQRTRLDLYCSMVFVLLLAATTAVARFGFRHWGYQTAGVVLAGLGCWVMYRAAISSARHYGGVLETIASHVSEKRAAEAERRSQRIRDLLVVTS